MNPSEAVCPICGSPISEAKRAQVQAELAGIRDQNIETRIAEVQKQAQAEAARTIQRETARFQANVLRDHQRALQQKQADVDRDRVQYLKKIKDLERALEQKTANQLGDQAEIDLLESLRLEFPGDQIKRIGKGKAGGDIIHDFIERGQVCGRVLIESKNCRAWQNSFLQKLRRDQVEANADHAVLATRTFPKGKKDLHTHDGIVIVLPSGVPQVVHLLRQGSIRIHNLRLTGRQRSDRLNQLYDYINSPSYAQQFHEIGRLAEGLADLDGQERRQHEKVWGTRGTVVAGIRNAMREIESQVVAIVEGTSESEPVVVANAS